MEVGDAFVLGIALLMTAKPELRDSLSIIGASVILGLLSVLPISRRNTSAPIIGSIQKTKN